MLFAVKQNRQISTFHSTGGALSFLFIVNIVLIYSIKVRVSIRVCVSGNISISWQKHHYKDYISQYVTYSGGDFLYSSADEFPMMLIAEDICRWWLDLCWYAYIGIGLALLVEVSPRQTSWQTKGLARPGNTFGQPRHLSWWTFEFSWKVAKILLAIFGENSRKIAKHFGYFPWSFTENNTYQGHEKWFWSWNKSLGLDLGLDKSLDISKPCCK